MYRVAVFGRFLSPIHRSYLHDYDTRIVGNFCFLNPVLY